jgi:hypothetical protein
VVQMVTIPQPKTHADIHFAAGNLWIMYAGGRQYAVMKRTWSVLPLGACIAR